MITLTKRLEQIGDIPSYVDVDKTTEYKKAIEYFAEKNPLVREVLSGNASLSELAKDLSKRYERKRWMLPIFHDKNYDEQVSKLEGLSPNVADLKTGTYIFEEKPWTNRILDLIDKKIMSPIVTFPLMGYAVIGFFYDPIFGPLKNDYPGSTAGALTAIYMVALAAFFSRTGKIMRIHDSVDDLNNLQNILEKFRTTEIALK